MSSRRTNLALLILVVTSFLSGWLAFGIGTGVVRWVLAAHGVLGLAIVVAAPWKTVIVRRGLRRARPGGLVGLALVAFATVTVLTGVLAATGAVRWYGPLRAMQVHVTAGTATLALAVVHAVLRPQRPRATDLSRRALLRAGGGLAAAGLAVAAVETVTRAAGLPGADRRVTGSFETGSFDPTGFPVTQWFNDTLPAVDADAWALRLVTPNTEEVVGLDALWERARPVVATLDCTGGWYTMQRWDAVPLSELIEPTGASFVAVSATEYRRRLPTDDVEGIYVAVGIDGQPLTRGHGAPARLVVPGRRGFWWVKWLTELRFDERSWWWQSPFPLT